ncbi:hypothetical protein KP509_18G071500 [Ceratopteris richardii]|nr:hypothetical protein KP509_18G071500 [Ceratopteris richardii]
MASDDDSPCSEIGGSMEGSQLKQLRDFMFDDNDTMDCGFWYSENWPSELMEMPLLHPVSSQQISYASSSGNSSEASTDEVVLHKKKDIAFMQTEKEHEAVSQSKLDLREHIDLTRGAGIWETDERLEGLEKMFIPGKCSPQEGQSFDDSIQITRDHQHVQEVSYPVGPIIENSLRDSLHEQERDNIDAGALTLNSSSKQHDNHNNLQNPDHAKSAQQSNEYVTENRKDKPYCNIASQTPGPISIFSKNSGIQVQQDITREFGLNPILGSSLGAGRSEADYSEICLVHLLIAGAEAVATRDMDLASVILVRLKELVSLAGSTMQRVAAYFSDGLQSRIEGKHSLEAVGYSKSQNDLLAAFQILHEISPYIKFGHFTANQAILEAVEGEKGVHIIDFEIMEGIQWPPLMQALVSRKGGPPHLRITALSRPHAEYGFASVHDTGTRLQNFASSINLPFTFNIVRVSNEEFSVSSIKVVKGEALVANCMLHLPHMPHRTASSVSSFLHGMRRLSPTVLTLVEEELGCSTTAVASYFVEALHYYCAICDSLEASLSSEGVARMLVERTFIAPRVNSTVTFWGGSSAQNELGSEFTTYNWCSLVRSGGFKSLPLSFQNLSQAKLLLGLYKDGFKLDERSNRLVLGWKTKPLFASSVWN